ncbi:MAG: hypothetical protein CMJ74_04495 [Planctomycetaceae bacterium]|nr:hypothetical protein [Planctomycetaceae bacterium]|tara:strand:+ start:3156 stop:3815 length:660 start_codon:yes stop_codon:yes gene_type:complete
MSVRLTRCLGIVALLVLLAASFGSAREQAVPVDLHEAIDSGTIDVKLIVKNGQQARIVAKNNTDQPLTIQVPEAFAAVPVLAQTTQGGGGTGSGLFNVPPEKVAKHDVGFVCLEHGKPDPRRTMQYELKPISAMTTDPAVVAILRMHGRQQIPHSVAQAAVWNLANGLSWQQLAKKERKNLSVPNTPYFSTAALKWASQLAAQTKQQFQVEATTAYRPQ